MHAAMHDSKALDSAAHRPARLKSESLLAAQTIPHFDGKFYRCPHCPKKFKFRSELQYHSSVHFDAKKHLCSLCPKAFKFDQNLIRHLKKSHSITVKVSRRNCSAEFEMKKPVFTRSSEKKSDFCGKKYACAHCPAKFKLKKLLVTHLKAHSSGRPYSCPHCHRMFGYRSQLNEHLPAHSSARNYACSLCTANFKYGYHLKRHLKKHTTDGEYSSKYCLAKFETEGQKIFHMLSHRREKMPNSGSDIVYACAHCSDTFKSKKVLTAHILKHHCCPYCPETFKYRQLLNRHLTVHSDTKNYACSQCPAKFKHDCDLKRHLKLHSLEGMHCANRSVKFETRSQVVSHTVTHFSEEKPSCHQRPVKFKDGGDLKSSKAPTKEMYSCGFCSAKFETREELRSHMIPHFGEEKPYSCQQCPAKFPDASGLSDHLHSAHSGKCFSCDHCSTKLTMSSSDLVHLRKFSWAFWVNEPICSVAPNLNKNWT